MSVSINGRLPGLFADHEAPPRSMMARRPLKVVYVVGTLDIGGTERQLVELATRLDSSRFLPTVVCLSSGGPLAEQLRAKRISVRIVGFEGSRGGGRAALAGRVPSLLRGFLRLVRIFRVEAPDIVHGLLFHAYLLDAPAARFARVPIVVAGRRSLGIFKVSRPLYLFLERAANRLTDLVIANSEDRKSVV